MPARSVDSYLIRDERVLHVDAPALKAFVVEELPIVAVTVLFGVGAVVWGANTGNLFLSGLALIGAGGLLLYLQVKRWSQQYTAYVLTTDRVMRLSGVFRRTTAFIPWVKVTDVRIEASFAGRLLGYATVYIDSANENSGLSEMKNLNDPRGFYLMLTEQVHVKQQAKPEARSALLHE